MLKLNDLEKRLQSAKEAWHSKAQDSEINSLCDEAEAFLVQALDAGLLSESEELRVHEMQQEVGQLRISSINVGGLDPQLKGLHTAYAKCFKRITKPHTKKSLENQLRHEGDAQKRKSTFETFRRDTDCPEMYSIILNILRARGPHYEKHKVRSRTFKKTEEIDTLITRMANALAPRFRELRTRHPWDFYYELENKNRVRATAPFQAYKNAAFHLIAEKFQIRVIPSSAPTYHKDVEVCELRDHNNGVLGLWHLDFFKRSGKYGGAWTQTALSRRTLNDGSVQTPLVFLGFDFEPDFISFHESRSFLHELGHALEHCLSQNGINDLAPDINEISSLYVESFMTDPLLLSLFDSETAVLLNNRAQQRIVDLTQICLMSKIDIELHRKPYHSVSDLKKMVEDVADKLDLFHPLVTPETLTIFDHAFADEEYASNYYTYLLSFVFAHVLKDVADTPLFWNFWHKKDPNFLNKIELGAIHPEELLEECNSGTSYARL